MRLFPLVIGLLAVFSVGLPTIVAVGSAGVVVDSVVIIGPATPTLKPLCYHSYEEAFAIPKLKPISFDSYQDAFAIPKLKPESFDTYEEAFATPKLKPIIFDSNNEAFAASKLKLVTSFG
jgi:hypothetical protein